MPYAVPQHLATKIPAPRDALIASQPAHPFRTLHRGAQTLQIRDIAMGEDSEKGLVENVMSGLIPGLAVGAFAGSARAYLSGVSDAERTAAMAAARASSRPPSAAALAAMAPTPPLRVIAVTTAMFAAVGGIFTGVEPMVKAMRGKDDVFNGAIAGCAAGSVVGLKSGSVLVSGGTCAAFAAMSAFIETLGLGHMHDYTEKRRRAVYGIVADDEK